MILLQKINYLALQALLSHKKPSYLKKAKGSRYHGRIQNYLVQTDPL